MTAPETDFSENLPIFSKRNEIITSVDRNQVTIITAETGAGKSTQVPQYLAEHGYRRVIVTQPRILAARNLCGRVREEMAIRTRKDGVALVGYRTAHERNDSPDNIILYCTDGLQMVRELTGSGSVEGQILVLDEIHEWNENMEVLLAWAKKRCREESGFKLVLMSATIETESLAAYFDGAAVIAVPGRSYPVEKQQGNDVISELSNLLDTRTSNVLVFLPGKAEIESVAAAIHKKALACRVPVLPLHGQLEPSVQQRVFNEYDNGKIILATNVAQTSITIGDIDVVIDSGLERRSEVRNGVEGLFIAQISRADCLQRAGRAGRTKEGVYILAQLNDLPCDPLEERPDYAVPEILRKHIDRLVLRLAAIGIDIEDLEFYHAPKRRAITHAKQKLVTLGALSSKGTVTPIGRSMERFPVESGYARMLVESEQFTPDVQARLAAIIAIQEAGGIVKHGSRYSGWRRLTHQTQSDLIAHYDVYLALHSIDPGEYEELGIIAKNVLKTEDIKQRLMRDLGLENIPLSPVRTGELMPLLRSIAAGQIDQLWSIRPNGEAVHAMTGQQRELSSGTVVKRADLVVGTPFDLEIPVPSGLQTLHLVTDVTSVDPAWLETLAPHLFSVKPGKLYYDPRLGTLATRTHLVFSGGTFDAAGPPVLDRTPDNQRLFVKLYSAWAYSQLEQERSRLQATNRRRVPAIPLRHIEKRVADAAEGAISLVELEKKQRLALRELTRLEAYIGKEFMDRLNRHSSVRHGKKHSRPFRPPRHKQKYNRRRGS